MAVVLASEENSYFSSTTLRRSHSQPKFVTKHTGGFHTSTSTSRLSDLYQPAKGFGDSTPSSAPSSPRAIPVGSTDLSYSSTPASNFSLASDCDEEDRLDSVNPDDHIFLPQYDDVGFYHQVEDLEPPPSPRTGDSYSASPNENDTSTYTSRPESPEVLDRAEDDLALRAKPSRHVDYLSHNWKEEDIWSSWKHIVSRRGDYTNAARLENASWRTWMKAKNKLSTVSPETLNWLKDCDVTWLYGPLQTGSSGLDPIHTDMNSARLSKSNSFISKKPILKKRSMSEVMLQRSISSSSLVKQAAAAVQAQQIDGTRRIRQRPGLERAAIDYISFSLSARRASIENGRLSSVTSSGVTSPSGERKHIHFNEQVAQCIAVEIKGEDDDEEQDTDRYNYDSDSDDGALTMKRTPWKRTRPIIPRRKVKPVNPNSSESKTIAMLPSTTLKYREDTPEPHESALKHSTGVYRSPVLSPSSSQETLRPSKKSGKFFVDDEDEDDEDAEEDDEGQSSSAVDWRSPSKFGEGSSGLHRSASTSSLGAEPAGMRRTESGMFMPLEEGESTSTAEGIFGRVIDTEGLVSSSYTRRFLPRHD